MPDANVRRWGMGSPGLRNRPLIMAKPSHRAAGAANCGQWPGS
jgi:hypothetical protein